MKDVVFKAITFIENGDAMSGHYFYNMTLAEAIANMAKWGFNPIKSTRVNITCYYW